LTGVVRLIKKVSAGLTNATNHWSARSAKHYGGAYSATLHCMSPLLGLRLQAVY
jgi:hypothetical protein